MKTKKAKMLRSQKAGLPPGSLVHIGAARTAPPAISVIDFGPDGLLYIGLGDGGSRAGEDDGRGQSLGDLLGSMLRIDVSAGSAYSVPADNPFVGTAGAQPEIWSYGLRNPWCLSFDRVTGDLWVTDVGMHTWE